jgi:hypothetical protein
MLLKGKIYEYGYELISPPNFLLVGNAAFFVYQISSILLVVNPSLYVYQISSKNGPSALTWHF